MNILADASSLSLIPGLILFLLVAFIALLALLMPLFVWLIYRQGVKTQKALTGYTDGINKILASLYHIQQNTTPVVNKDLPDIKL